MARKPTYEELERKVRELEKVADECMRTESAFQASDQEKKKSSIALWNMLYIKILK